MPKSESLCQVTYTCMSLIQYKASIFHLQCVAKQFRVLAFKITVPVSIFSNTSTKKAFPVYACTHFWQVGKLFISGVIPVCFKQ